MQRKLVVLIQEEITKEGKESLALAQAKYTRATCPYSHSNEGHMTHITKSKPRVQPATSIVLTYKNHSSNKEI